MDKEIYKLIEEKGPEIAKQLQIATTQVYEKVLWYIQIDGIIGLVKMGIGVVVFVFYLSFLRLVEKKLDTNWEDGSSFAVWAIGLAFFLIVFLIGAIFLDLIGANVAKVFFPEYYLIGQVINKVN